MTKASIIGWGVGIVVFVVLMNFVPPTTCYDGWQSPSVGRQGACSHHGGVNNHSFLKFMVFCTSVGAGLWAYSAVLGKKQKVSDNNILYSQIRQKDICANSKHEYVAPIQDAIKHQKSVEFLYKKPSQSKYMKRTVRPIRLVNINNRFDSDDTLCLFGFCELRKANRNFALKRMKELKILNKHRDTSHIT